MIQNCHQRWCLLASSRLRAGSNTRRFEACFKSLTSLLNRRRPNSVSFMMANCCHTRWPSQKPSASWLRHVRSIVASTRVLEGDGNGLQNRLHLAMRAGKSLILGLRPSYYVSVFLLFSCYLSSFLLRHRPCVNLHREKRPML